MRRYVRDATAVSETESDSQKRLGQSVATEPAVAAAAESGQSTVVRYGTTTSDAALVQGVRIGESGAYLEFFHRFAPLLRRDARRYGHHGDAREELVQDWLTDGALRVADYTRPVPQALAAYLVVGFRRRLHRLRQTTDREDACAHAVMTERADSTLSDRPAACDELQPPSCLNERWRTQVGSSTGVASSSDAGPDTRWLANQLLARLSAADRMLLQWLGERVPQREIGQWLGITHGAARVRATRLRARLRALTTEILSGLSADIRQEFTDLLHRSALLSAPAPADDANDRPGEDDTP